LNPERYTEITRGGSIEDALAGIRAAGAAGLPVKINMVVLGDSSKEEIDAMRDYCASINARLQLINHFDLTRQKKNAARSGGENAAGSGRENGAGRGGENAAGSGRAYTFDRPPACAGCNRIRLLADGTLKPCLHSDEEVRLDPARLTESLREAILAKPRLGGACTNRPMRQIGG
jgi:cyclic pyranopterin phosphate synthase